MMTNPIGSATIPVLRPKILIATNVVKYDTTVLYKCGDIFRISEKKINEIAMKSIG
ncbi:MAG: hypothetical protein LUC38_00405 [Oscillospiraceae bacterium]|nr:hypothetical protein [Oscillospiraceae bacterium]